MLAWEHFLDVMAADRLQAEYKRAIAQRDLFVMLFHTRVGRHTLEEFETAFGAFKAHGKPCLLTHYKQALASGRTAAAASRPTRPAWSRFRTA